MTRAMIPLLLLSACTRPAVVPPVPEPQPDPATQAVAALRDLASAEDPALRAIGSECLALLEAPPPVREPLADMSEHFTPEVVAAMAAELTTGTPRERAGSIDILRHRPAATRQPYLPRIGELLGDDAGTAPDVPDPFAAQLGSPRPGQGDKAVGDHAALALAGLGEEAVPALAAALGSPSASARGRAAVALGVIGAPAVVALPALVGLVADEAEIAGGFAPPAAATGLVTWYRPATVAEGALFAIGAIARATSATPAAAFDAARMIVAPAARSPRPGLRLLAARAVPVLMPRSEARALLRELRADPDGGVACTAVAGLGEVGSDSPEDARALAAMLDTLVPGRGRGACACLRGAAHALGSMESVPADLAGALLAHEERASGCYAPWLGGHFEPDSRVDLALARIGPSIVPELAHAMVDGSATPMRRSTAARALAHRMAMGDAAARAALAEALASSDAVLRDVATGALPAAGEGALPLAEDLARLMGRADIGAPSRGSIALAAMGAGALPVMERAARAAANPPGVIYRSSAFGVAGVPTLVRFARDADARIAGAARSELTSACRQLAHDGFRSGDQ